MIDVTVTAEQPLSLLVEPVAGNVAPTADHVPGAALRGALAGRWIREHGAPTEVPADKRAEFIRLFEGSVRYGPLFPVGSSREPLSVVRCKYRPQVRCAAVAWDEAAREEPESDCPVCGGPTARCKGELEGGAIVEHTRTELGGNTTLAERRRLAVPTDAETAKDKGLHTTRALPAGTVLRGTITGDAERWLDSCDGAMIWLGRRKTVAGRARVRLGHAPDPVPSVDDDPTRLVVRLTSPAIVVDAATRPCPDRLHEELARRLGVSAASEQAWIRPVIVGGWHAAAGLPRPRELAAAAGSVVVLRCQTPPGPAQLAGLASGGFGLRRAEGFGHVELNPSPWRPPAPAAASTASSPDHIAVLALALRAELDLRDRRWIAGHLRAALTGGRAFDPLAFRRFRSATPTVQGLLEAAAAVRDRDDVRRLSDEIVRLDRA